MAQMTVQLQKRGCLQTQSHPKDARLRPVFPKELGYKARPEAVAAGDRVEGRWAELTSAALPELRAARKYVPRRDRLSAHLRCWSHDGCW
jgi:hypothetical protein